MKREIKFRAWTGDTMMYRGIHDRNWYNEDNKCIKGAHSDDRHFLFTDQFTGLKDKNGKEIYEGDIVKTYFKGKLEGISIVEWDICNPTFILRRTPERFTADVEFDFVACDLRTIEIIGNIHQDKHLLDA